jgi:hypothetical protein
MLFLVLDYGQIDQQKHGDKKRREADTARGHRQVWGKGSFGQASRGTAARAHRGA